MSHPRSWRRANPPWLRSPPAGSSFSILPATDRSIWFSSPVESAGTTSARTMTIGLTSSPFRRCRTSTFTIQTCGSSISRGTATPTFSCLTTVRLRGTRPSPKQASAPARRVQQALDEEDGPRLVFADRTESLYLADLSGDGLTDVVRIRNGEVCYWPSLGYGRFGPKVTMDGSPWFDAPDQFEQRRIRLGDIDGSGTGLFIWAAMRSRYGATSRESLEHTPAAHRVPAHRHAFVGDGPGLLEASPPRGGAQQLGRGDAARSHRPRGSIWPMKRPANRRSLACRFRCTWSSASRRTTM